MKSRRKLFANRSLCIALVLSALRASSAVAQLPPDEALQALRASDGLQASLFASEPMVTNPSAIDIDTRGRVWVAEIEWYRMSAKSPPSDKIKVLEDTDGDGRADRSTVFAEGLLCPMSICVAWPRIYVATSPDLWVYEDRNDDLKADGPPVKLLTGFGGKNHDHGAHSLVLGPDHKWWMSHGDAGFDVTGTDGSRAAFRWGAVLRGELDGSQLEVVARNFRNPYEVCVSSFGESFVSDNDNDGNFSVRICWLLEGGDYGWFGRPPAKPPAGTPMGEHWHFRGHLPGFVPATLVTGFGSPCGICFYEGSALGAAFHDVPIHADAGPGEVRMYPHELAGAGYKARSEVILRSEDRYFRPDDVCVAPDGTLYVSDWYDGGVGGHAYNNPTQGRIYHLARAGESASKCEPGPYKTVEAAIEGLKSPNLATQFLARERLLEGTESAPALKNLVADGEPDHRARALWLLDRMGDPHRATVLEQLDSDDPRMRALAVRILRRHGSQYQEQLLARADDHSEEVRREVLLALPRLEGAAADAALSKIARRYDGQDRYLLETIRIAAAGRERWLYEELVKDELAASAGKNGISPRIDLLQALDGDRAANRLVEQFEAEADNADTKWSLLERIARAPSAQAGRAVLKTASNGKAPLEVRRRAIDLLDTYLAGSWSELVESDDLRTAVDQLLGDDQLCEPALTLVERHDLKTCGPAVLAVAASKNRDPASRSHAVTIAARLKPEGCAGALEGLLADNDAKLRSAALAGLVELQDWRPLKNRLASVKAPAAGSDSKSRGVAPNEVADQMLDSTAGALVLLRMIDSGELGADLRERVVARAAEHADTNVRVLFERLLPAEKRPARLGEAVDAAQVLALKGDRDRGRQIFEHSTAARCNACHRVQGYGGNLGPDLSAIGRKYERGALLETILFPSKAIAPEYVPYVVETDDGHVLAGFLVERSDQMVVLKDVDGRAHRLPAKRVEHIEPQKQSLMPDLVLRDVTAQDAADLLAFLESLQADQAGVAAK